MDLASDPDVRAIRERITTADEQILGLLNERLDLVASLARLKVERGYDFLDPGREQRLLEHLGDANAGPLSRGGVDELFRFVLDLTKRELGR